MWHHQIFNQMTFEPYHMTFEPNQDDFWTYHSFLAFTASSLTSRFLSSSTPSSDLTTWGL